jgi:cellulose synthase/poly-beta-1,6-N-acetylglucosamine synthase-like glycosyltransferase
LYNHCYLIVYLHFLTFRMIFLLITILLFLPYAILILYYWSGWLDIPDFIPLKKIPENELPFVSIIIAARNEEKNIGNCLQSIINQTYPKNQCEVIVTDDHSTDATVSIINGFQKENIRVINLSDFLDSEKINSYKKKSIETALQFAKGELIVTTDADCMVPPKWIETLVVFYKEKNPVFVASPVTFPSSVGSVIQSRERVESTKEGLGVRLLKIFQTLDFMTLQGITGASVSKKFHGMCNGANLAYEKKVFYEVGGFEGIDEIASGDDMLLMDKIQKVYPDRVMFLKSREVIVETQPASTLKDFLNQRIRWASKADKYTDKKITTVLVLVYLFNAWILILGISSFFYHKSLFLFLITIGIKIITELFFLYPVARFFGRQKLLWWFIPAQPFHIIYTLVAGWLGKFGTYRWKGRKVK